MQDIINCPFCYYFAVATSAIVTCGRGFPGRCWIATCIDAPISGSGSHPVPDQACCGMNDMLGHA
eukprot:364051-Chlamydomonas_euryale.AAC.6